MFLFLSLLFISFSSFCSELASANVVANHKVGKVKLHHKNDNFFVEQNGVQYKVQKYWMDPELRKISKKQLNAFLGNGYIAVNKLENNEFTLKAKVRGLGGGPVTGYAAYCCTKVLCYGAAAAAVIGVSTAATGAAVGYAGGTAAATMLAKGTAVAVVKTAVTGTVLSTTPVAAVGAALASTAATAELAALGTASVVTTAAGSSAGVIAGSAAIVEAASLGVGAFFTAIPFLP